MIRQKQTQDGYVTVFENACDDKYEQARQAGPEQRQRGRLLDMAIVGANRITLRLGGAIPF
jgi:hypothetical protein